MKTKKWLSLFFVLILCAALFGCQNTADNTGTTNEESTSEDGDSLYGQVESIDGNEVTLALAETPQGGNAMPEGEMPEGQIPEGEMPEGQIPEGEMPEGQIPEGEMPEDMEEGQMPGLNLTGETKVITLTDDMLADIAVGDIIIVKMDNNTVTSAVKAGMGGGPGNRPDADPENAAGSQSEETGDSSAEDTADAL